MPNSHATDANFSTQVASRPLDSSCTISCRFRRCVGAGFAFLRSCLLAANCCKLRHIAAPFQVVNVIHCLACICAPRLALLFLLAFVVLVRRAFFNLHLVPMYILQQHRWLAMHLNGFNNDHGIVAKEYRLFMCPVVFIESLGRMDGLCCVN